MSELVGALSWMGLDRLRKDLERQIERARREGGDTTHLEQRLSAVKQAMEGM
jgi:hypothetical protein